MKLPKLTEVIKIKSLNENDLKLSYEEGNFLNTLLTNSSNKGDKQANILKIKYPYSTTTNSLIVDGEDIPFLVDLVYKDFEKMKSKMKPDVIKRVNNLITKFKIFDKRAIKDDPNYNHQTGEIEPPEDHLMGRGTNY